MLTRPIVFFADRLPPQIGGVEVHAKYFIQYFKKHPLFPLKAIITKDQSGNDLLISEKLRQKITLASLEHLLQPAIVFFNSGRWIENLPLIREIFPKACFIYRTGGNEILKASLYRLYFYSHAKRQSYWVNTLNSSLDYLITNSAYTEKRLISLGIHVPLIRCVGGVNSTAIARLSTKNPTIITFFSAARFVPYKNHVLLLSVFKELLLLGFNIKLRLAGDGPLLEDIKNFAYQTGIALNIDFLGALDNFEVCKEIVAANIYIQLSANYKTKVPGGSYVHSEGMGRSILEALTAGTFVVAADSGALSEIVTKDRGLLVSLGSPKKIAEEIKGILVPPLIKAPFTDKFSWEKVFKQYEDFFGGSYEHTLDYGKM